ncbi:ATP-grasp domain-containing protein [Streptomyces sp. NPDC054766]|uniref:ATP-grasp domain-containing protein n=1 Tax=Streptomyces rhizosphaerihabitans TaxID=1266770 RepID=UPI0021C0D21E|nr:ATP-grasp domain-containing protein [Streptomyces rhizosphaerihabitans]MCT9008506.1 ATP-grasp domain-containing protein [Streptomyces rhizosphaerihabitans]
MATHTPGDNTERPLLLLVGPGMQLFREYLFKSISTRYRVHLLNTAQPSWEAPYLSGHTVVADMGAETLTAAAQKVAAEEPLAGVLSWDEARILSAAHVAAALGLPGGDVEAVERCRDKFLTREALAVAGVPQPMFHLVTDVQEALAAADRIGYPVVLKPRSAAASYGVVLVADAAELAARFPFSREATVPDAPRHESAVLVEEYLDAPEISVDAVVHRGEATPMYVARKQTGFPPYFEETGHLLDAADPLLGDPALLTALRDTHRALGYQDGWTHTEFKLTADGPKVIEVNGRLGGDLIPHLGALAAGSDPGLAAASAACGRPPHTARTRSLVAGIRFFYPEADETVIDSVSFDEDALAPLVSSAVVVARPGSVVSPPPKGITSGRIAFATALADSADKCRAALDSAESALRVRLVPAGGSA